MFSHPCQLLFFFFHTFQSVEITAAVEKGRECGVYGWDDNGRQGDRYLDDQLSDSRSLIFPCRSMR